MTIPRLIAIGVIFAATACAWALLGTALTVRSERSALGTREAVTDNWGPEMIQVQPRVYYASPTDEGGYRDIGPRASEVAIDLFYEPKQKGLVRHRAWRADFDASWTIENPTPIRQTIYFEYAFPAEDTPFTNFQLLVDGGEAATQSPRDGLITEAVVLEPGASAPVQVSFETRGLNEWRYHFAENGSLSGQRVRDFHLAMTTNFEDIDFPAGVGSPTEREVIEGGWRLQWSYPNVIDAPAIGMAMPKILNPGPTAQRIAFFAPISLLFFFSAVIALMLILKTPLHPMNFFFLAAACFAFQLLFSYLVDHLNLTIAFVIAGAVSVGLVFGYLRAVAGSRFARLAATAQFFYMVLFSYSFFFDGYSGLVITIGSILTLAVLMKITATMDWSTVFQFKGFPGFRKVAAKVMHG